MPTALRQAIFFALLIALPVASYFFVFKPQNTQIEKAKKEIEHKQAMLEKLKQATAQADDLARQNEQIGKAIESIEARLPDGKQMDEVLRQVSSLTSKSGLRVPAFKRSDKVLTAGTAMEQPLNIEITGNFDGFYQFLLDLEQLPRITRIPDFSIVRSDEVDGEMMTKLTLSIYYEGSNKDAK